MSVGPSSMVEIMGLSMCVIYIATGITCRMFLNEVNYQCLDKFLCSYAPGCFYTIIIS